VDPHFYWYLTRAAGVVTFGLLALSTALGLLISTRLGDKLFERAWVFEIHKFASVLGLAFVGLHMAALLPDPWTRFRVIDLLVPGASSYWRPWAVAAGVLAMYGSVIGTATFYVRKYLGHRTWRLLHYTTFATFYLALLHGLAAGTDAGEGWMQLMYAGSGLLIGSLTLYRAVDAEPKAKRRAPLAAPPEVAA
jgi:predicted ferric reductase